MTGSTDWPASLHAMWTTLPELIEVEEVDVAVVVDEDVVDEEPEEEVVEELEVVDVVVVLEEEAAVVVVEEVIDGLVEEEAVDEEELDEEEAGPAVSSYAAIPAIAMITITTMAARIRETPARLFREYNCE